MLPYHSILWKSDKFGIFENIFLLKNSATLPTYDTMLAFPFLWKENEYQG